MNKDSLRLSGLGLLIALVGFFVAYQFVEPSPPKTITLASGSDTGAYFKFAKRYQDILARNGVRVEILNTQGSVENIELLKANKADIAFVQGGVGNAEREPSLVSLGSLYFEPLWVFVQKDAPISTLNDLQNRPISAGSNGSGTWAVAKQVLTKNDVDVKAKNVRHMSSADAAKGLLSGELDAAFFVTSPSSPLIGKLLKIKRLRLLNFARADAYTRQLRHLSAVTLSQGVVSLSQNIPATPVTLLAPAATLAAHANLHPALQNLLVQASQEIFADGTIFSDPGTFPSTRFNDYPLSADAKRYLTEGEPFLQRYLPFWGAVMFDRLKVMLVPLLTLLFPLFKIFPPAYRWRVRSRIYRWYASLAELEARAQNEPVEALIAELNLMETDVKSLKVPLSYRDEVYNLRLHMDLIKRSL